MTLSETTSNRPTLHCRLSASGQSTRCRAASSYPASLLGLFSGSGWIIEQLTADSWKRECDTWDHGGPSAASESAGSLCSLSAAAISAQFRPYLSCFPSLFILDALNSVVFLRVILKLNSKTCIKSDEVAVGQTGHQRVSSKPIISPACNLWTSTTYLAPAAWEISQQTHFGPSPFI